MPPGKWSPFRPQPIGARRRQPGERPRQVGRELEAIPDAAPAARIIGATAGFRIEQPTSQVGEMDDPGVFILKLHQTAAAAAIAKALPFPWVEGFERLGFPKRSFLVCHAIAATPRDLLFSGRDICHNWALWTIDHFYVLTIVNSNLIYEA